MKNYIILFCFLLIGLTSSANINAFLGAENTEPLKAVLIVGPQEDGTKSAIVQMQKVASFLKSKGVTVFTFFDKDTDWEKIKKAADGAAFFIYSGHGNSSCGFTLSKPITNEEIIKNLNLKKNALVLFQSVCYGAGSSAGDDIDIGLKEASIRVTNYAKAFIEKGTGCYFAINSNDGALDFLKDFYAGKTVQQCFEKSIEFFYKIGKVEKSSLGENLKIAIASSDWGGTATRTTYTNGVKKVEEVPNVKSYSIAYISHPDFNLVKLKQQ